LISVLGKGRFAAFKAIRLPGAGLRLLSPRQLLYARGRDDCLCTRHQAPEFAAEMLGDADSVPLHVMTVGRRWRGVGFMHIFK